MHQWLAQATLAHPERDFVVTDERAFSYRDIESWSHRLAAGLASRGVQRGDHVAMLMANYAEYVALKFAVNALGAVAVPLNFMLRRDELAFVLRHSKARALITMTGFRDLDYLAMLDEIAPGWELGSPDSLPDLQFVVQFAADGPMRHGVPTFDDLNASGANAGAPAAKVDSQDVSVIFYTSGTTGSPKGVMWTHDSEARVGYGGALTRAFSDGWRVQSALPLYHAFANNEVLHATMFAGGAMIPRAGFDVDDFLTSIERHRPTEIVTVPTMVVALCESRRTAVADTRSLVALMCAGAPAPAWLWERAIKLLGVEEVTTGYGMTETGGGPVMSRPEDGIEHVSSTVGRMKLGGAAALPDMDGVLTEMRTVDSTSGQSLPRGSEGELISRGPTNALRYWGESEATAETFRGEWVFTGDLGRITPDGAVQLTGRKKDLIRSGGENFAPKEVEDLLTSQPGVSQVYVVGVPDIRWGEVGCAWIVLDRGALVTEAELRVVCKEKLAGFKRPRQYRFIPVEDLPKTPTGKVQKFLLSERAIRDAASSAGDEVPRR